MNNEFENLDLEAKNDFESKFRHMFSSYIDEFKGVLISWSTDKRLPTIAPEFIESLPETKKRSLQELLSAL